MSRPGSEIILDWVIVSERSYYVYGTFRFRHDADAYADFIRLMRDLPCRVVSKSDFEKKGKR